MPSNSKETSPIFVNNYDWLKNLNYILLIINLFNYCRSDLEQATLDNARLITEKEIIRFKLHSISYYNDIINLINMKKVINTFPTK